MRTHDRFAIWDRRNMNVMTSTSVAIRDFVTAVRNWIAVMAYLAEKRLNEDIGAGKFGILLALAEPIIFIIAIYFIRGIFRMFTAYYGTSLMLFLVSGFMPFFFFVRLSLQFRGGQRNVRRLMPRINSMDMYLAGIMVTALIWLVMIGFVLLALWEYGIDLARPKIVTDCAAALGLLFMIALGLGLIHTSIIRFIPFWKIMVLRTSRGLLLVSGVIQMPILLPSRIRSIVDWNPVTHAIEWFRVGLYGTSYPALLDRSFAVYCALILLFIGLVADRATLRYAGR
jgi:capsular polysaccharide transport system permease protein